MKNMKKFAVLVCLFVIAGTSALMAQSSANATLNVRLHPIQTIVVNPAQNIVNLDYVTETDYASGVSSEQKDHLTVYSTGAFVVKANSSSSTLESNHQDVTENIDASDIVIRPEQGSNQLSGATFTTINLSDQAQSIISNSTGGVDRTFNINYAGAGANSYVNKFFNVENPTVYTTTVIYTIEAQ